LWQAYFDNHPHGHYGTIRQQWWALLHFFLHLGYVGVVEGSNQMATFYYALRQIVSFETKMHSACDLNYSNEELVSYINGTLSYLKLQKYATIEYNTVQLAFTDLLDHASWPNQDMCASSDALGYLTKNVLLPTRDAILARYGVMPSEGEDHFFHTLQVTYTYYWCSLALTLITLLVFVWVVRRHHRDRFEWIRMSWRILMAILSLAIMFLRFSKVTLIRYLMSPTVVVTVVVMMTLTLVIDRICRVLGVKRFKRHYQVPVDHDSDHEHGHEEHDPPGHNLVTVMQPPLKDQGVVVTDSGAQFPQPQGEIYLTSYPPAGPPTSYPPPSNSATNYNPTTYPPAPYQQSPIPTPYNNAPRYP
jgi:hypothetical protein